MAWETELVRMIRHFNDDLDESNYKYSDSRLEELVLVAAQHVMMELSFDSTYTVDLDELTLSPDPTTSSPKDNAFINLITIKAMCILSLAESKTASSQAISISDQGSSIELGNRATLLGEASKTWCAGYQQAKKEYLLGSLSPGLAIVSPFRLDGNGFQQGNNYHRYYPGLF